MATKKPKAKPVTLANANTQPNPKRPDWRDPEWVPTDDDHSLEADMARLYAAQRKSIGL